MHLQLKLATTKKLVFMLALWPLVSIGLQAYFDQLGANPVELIERHFGKWTLIFLCLTLAMTPLRKLTNNGQWVLYRRMLGLFVFFYSTVHLLCYVGIDYQFAWQDMKDDILKHRYVLVGFLAWLLLIPLALTSTKKMIARLRTKWKKLHRLVYVIAILGLLHFFWLIKKDMTQPLIFTGVIVVLLLLRIDSSAFKAKKST
jgi:sulfoxide reductase heme-binding subunit YedZ